MEVKQHVPEQPTDHSLNQKGNHIALLLPSF